MAQHVLLSGLHGISMLLMRQIQVSTAHRHTCQLRSSAIHKRLRARALFSIDTNIVVVGVGCQLEQHVKHTTTTMRVGTGAS